MTMTTRYSIVCACGHTGVATLRENDAPFSSPWEQWTLEGFRDESPERQPPGASVLPGLRCPSCKTKGRVRWA